MELKFGIVENNNDPDKLGRVQVRVFSIHPLDKQKLPTEDLPWAIILMTANGSSTSGVGTSATGIENGTKVVVSFFDDEYQVPFILGSYHGMPSESARPSKGFNDPNGEFPRYINESDINKSARGESHPQLESRKNVKSGVPIASGGTWSEPTTAWNPEYPRNKVMETVNGHMIEIDDTDGSERILIQHTSGSFFEIHPDGSVVLKSKDRYTVTAGDDSMYVAGNVNITCDGNANIMSNANTTIFTAGLTNIISGGSATITAPAITLAGGTIDLGEDAKESLVLGDSFKDFLNQQIAKYNSHTHIIVSNMFGAVAAPTVTSQSPMTDSQLSDVNKTL